MPASPLASVSNANATPGLGGPDPKDRPETPEEAAEQFEQMLVKQFVDGMTKGLYKSTLSGEDGPSWMKGQRDAQRDVLTDVLTDHLVEAEVLGIRERMLKQWSSGDAAAEDAPDTPPLLDAPPDASETPPTTPGTLARRLSADN